MRVTDGMTRLQSARDLALAQRRLASSQRQASSGLRLQVASDDPAAAARLLQTDAQRAALAVDRTSIGRSLGELAAADAALAGIGDSLARAHEISLAMANGTMTSSERASAAVEVEDLRQHILGLANTQVAGIYIFNGQRTDAAPFDPTTGAFVGDGGVRRIVAAPGQAVEVNVTAAEALTASGGRDVMADLTALSTALASNDVAGVRAAAGTLTLGQQQVVEARASAGMLSARLTSLDSTLGDQGLQLDAERSRLADADPVSTLSEMALAQHALQAALQASASILGKLSLVDKL